jgi:integrase
MAKINKRAIDELCSVNEKTAYLWDDQLKGFGVKALPSGKKTFIVKYRAQGGGRKAPQRWLTLGSYGQLTVDQARKLAQSALGMVATGVDPQREKLATRNAQNVGDLWDRFSTEHLPLRKPLTRRDYEAQWRDLIGPKFAKATVDSVSRSDVDRFHKSMRHSPYRANRVLALLSRLMSLAEAWGLREQGSNPCKYVERFAERPRTRFLSTEELRRIGDAMHDLKRSGLISIASANAIELLILTGARLNEILVAEWDWIDIPKGLLNLTDSKNGAKTIFLSDAATSLLSEQREIAGESPFVFPSPHLHQPLTNLRKSWVRICDEAGIEGVRLHDLRHTAASIAVGQGASLPIVGRLLGHTQAQTTLRYAHVDADPAIFAANQIGSVVTAAIRRKRNNHAS